ncbi:hypothetical protein [Thermonema rossianum]|nr:hypothetical protein [Thermonema rossianum]
MHTYKKDTFDSLHFVLLKRYKSQLVIPNLPLSAILNGRSE